MFKGFFNREVYKFFKIQTFISFHRKQNNYLSNNVFKGFFYREVYKFFKIKIFEKIMFNIIKNPDTELDYLFENFTSTIFFDSFFVINIMITLLYGVVFSMSNSSYPLLLKNMARFAMANILFILIFNLNNYSSEFVDFHDILIFDELTSFFKILLLLSAFFSIIISLDYLKQEKINSFEYITLILFSICSMLFMISTYDFITMYLTIELQSLCFYVLAASKRNSEFSTEAGLKYFILGAFSSGIILFGCSLIYGLSGVTNFEMLSKLVYEIESQPALISNGILVGIVFLAVGLLFKLTAAPFHMWAPDVYEGSPTVVTAFFAIMPKIAILALFIRLFLYSVYDLIFYWQTLLILCSVNSMVLGALAATYQTRIKRLLAYSSIGHVGYLLIGLVCGTIEGLQGVLLYLIIYIIMTINVFAILLMFSNQRQNKKKLVKRIKYLTDLSFLSKTNGTLALTFLVTLFSMAGIPPLAGFMSKFYLFFAAFNSSFYWVAFVGVTMSVVSCFYYIRFTKIMYFEKPKNWFYCNQISFENSLVLAVTFFIILFFFLFPAPLFLITEKVLLLN